MFEERYEGVRKCLDDILDSTNTADSEVIPYHTYAAAMLSTGDGGA